MSEKKLSVASQSKTDNMPSDSISCIPVPFTDTHFSLAIYFN